MGTGFESGDGFGARLPFGASVEELLGGILTGLAESGLVPAFWSGEAAGLAESDELLLRFVEEEGGKLGLGLPVCPSLLFLSAAGPVLAALLSLSALLGRLDSAGSLRSCGVRCVEKPGESNAGMLRLRTLLISSWGGIGTTPISSIADPDTAPTKLFGLLSSAECEGRNWAPAVSAVRSADRLYRSGAARIGAAGASENCDDAPLLPCERGAVELLLLPGTGKAESSWVARCKPPFAVLGRLVVDELAP